MHNLAELATDAAAALQAHKHTVAVAESASGGLISAALLAVPGASDYYAGGSVVYTLAARKQVLGIRRDDVAGLEPLTEPLVMKFAERARAQLDATWGIAELGVAGPTPARYGHSAGICVIAVAGPRPCALTVQTGHNHREANMWSFTRSALQLLAQAVTLTEE